MYGSTPDRGPVGSIGAELDSHWAGAFSVANKRRSHRVAMFIIGAIAISACFATLLSLIHPTQKPLHRLQPHRNRILHCAGQANADFSGSENFKQYSSALSNETHPMVFMVYVSLVDPPTDFQHWFAALESQLTPYDPSHWLGVNIGLWFAGNDSRITDYQIEDFVLGAALLRRPIWLRIGYEFNGQWNIYVPGPFQEVWKRLTRALRANPITERLVATVWDFTCDASSDRLDYMQWYPGDEWVDWWGVNVFSGPSAPNSSLVTSFVRHGASLGFPVMLGEATPRFTGVSNWDAWHQPFFNQLVRDRRNGIQAICYINQDWGQTPMWADWGDSRIDTNPVVGALYQKELKRSIYVHGGDQTHVLHKLRLW